MSLLGKLYINGTDAYERYGMFALKGAFSEMLILPKTKERISNNWGDSNGAEVDLSEVYTQEHEYSLTCAMVSNSVQSLTINLEFLKKELLSEGILEISVPDIYTVFSLYYVDCNNFRIISQAGKSGKSVASFTLKFRAADTETINTSRLRITAEGELRMAAEGAGRIVI